ncbi:MAG: hypothetical protein VX899_23880 [Myxococcota bacterium]|nr:hypothetical protein [Myxococcota bacterium]
MSPYTPLTLFLSLSGCTEPELAPPVMDETTRLLWTQWDDEDTMEGLIADLYDLTDDVDTELDWEERSYIVTAFDRASIEDLVEHDRDPTETFGIGLVYHSPWTPVDHMDIIAIEDRTVLESSSPNLYERTFVEGDPECMLDGGCSQMRTHNYIRRENFFYGQMTYATDKSFRWITTPSGEQAIVARAFQIDRSEELDNKIHLLQSYALDVWLPDEGGSRRYHMNWQQTEMPGGLEDSEIAGVLGGGIQDLMESQDAWLEDQTAD